MDEANQETLLELANLCEYWGQDIQPSQVFIEDIDLSQCKYYHPNQATYENN